MPSYPIPHDEEARLKILHDHDMLDLGDDPDFDDVVHLAAVMCDVPISLVTYIDADRQVFKARVGLRSTHTPRSISFCAHAIAQRELFIVEDARVDDRFRDNPDVTGGPMITFYAGMPIVSPDNVALGTLCVIDHEPRELDAKQREGLRLLARVIATHIRKRIEQLAA